MSDTSKAVGGLLFGFLKVPLMLGGLVTAVVGLFQQNSLVFTIGVAALILGFVVQAIDRAALAKTCDAWAREAVEGAGPVPPRDTQLKILRMVAAGEGVGGDVEGVFKATCRLWAADQSESPATS
ncbi:hypothetical protein [Sanguibacter suarezii]|uniref:hypothetical protein n=1 Tax=Sanguibacter suarezii TaxID=60921 RepID=UPI00083533FD|nr:hypothetical protein [Sanguibacter suarezii]